MTNDQITNKLHCCFAHSSPDKLLKLINNAGRKWADTKELKECLKSVSENCETCKTFKKAPPRPIVSLPMSSSFQELVSIDLKFFENKIILHLIDVCTRHCSASFIPNKKKETKINAIFKTWMAIYGNPRKFLIDNGGEWANKEFLEMCDSLGTDIKTTAAESP